jgi:hypothetical protein|tara:strand:- start:360 stop:647 length:288 start_codon:yes stop_codon:yes gene_type:complete
MLNNKERRNNMNKEEKIRAGRNAQEVRKKIRKANNCYVWAMLDGQDVGQYFKTSKTEVLYWVRKYLRDNGNNDYCDFENLNNTIVLREDGDLYVN